jgi:hypothetical protein
MRIHESGFSRIDAKCNTSSELVGDRNLIEMGEVPFNAIPGITL